MHSTIAELTDTTIAPWDDEIDDEPDARAAWDAEPVSVEAARAERAALAQAISDINTQLASRKIDPGLPMDQIAYNLWRTRAVWAKRHKERRVMFLRDWLIANDPRHTVRGPKAVPNAGELTRTLRAAAQRAGLLESVYVAVSAYVLEETDEAWAEVVRRLEWARTAFEETAKPEGSHDA